MDADRWDRLQGLFDEAVALAPAERSSFLDRACGGDGELRRELESLLEQDARSTDVLGDVVSRAAARTAQAGAASPIGRRIGRYRIERELGHGGMGRVYLAVRDDDEYHMQVAIKLIRGGSYRPELLERFRSERQILANLDHANIARLMDGGTTEDGEPFVVMEYVEGEPIDRYCGSRRLSTEERLALFRTVCEAVQYAHRNLVVHRDIKPGNILVTSDGVPKLLDFGIAKLVEADPVAQEVRTVTALRPMTPEYASPEQIKGEPITTATDVYSLGVMLYELLAGCFPYRITTDRPRELEDAICGQVPEKPSTAAGRGSSEGVGTARRIDSRRLKKRLSGDLDNIVLNALRKEPDRRYASVRDFSEDIRRHLEGLPITARPATIGYRARKFIARNKIGVLTATAVVVLTATLVAFYTVRLSREREKAQLESIKSDRISDFLVDLVANSDPERARGEAITVREVLDRGAGRVRQELSGQPEAQGALMETMGRAYNGLGLFQSARPLLEEALEIRRSALGEEHPDVAMSLQALGDLLYEMGEYDRAADLSRQSLAMNRKLHGNQSDEVALNLNDLGWLLSSRGDYEESEAMHREALSIRRAIHGEESPEIAESLNNLGVVLMEKAEYEESERIFREALAMRRKVLGENHPQTSYTVHNLAVVLEFRGELAASEATYREAIEIDRRLHGDEHPDFSTSYINLSRLLRRQGKLEEAEAMARDAVAIDRKFRGDDHPYVAYDLNKLGEVLVAKGDREGAERAFLEAIAINKEKLPEGDAGRAAPLESLASLRIDQGRFDEAESLLRESLVLRRSSLGETHPTLAVAEAILGRCLVGRKRYEEAESLLLRSHRVLREQAGDGDDRTLEVVRGLVGLYEASGRPEEAERWASLLPAGGSG